MKDQRKTKKQLESELSSRVNALPTWKPSSTKPGGLSGLAERSRAMVEGFDGLIYICSQDFRVEFMNKRFIRAHGLDRTGELCYRALHDLDSICRGASTTGSSVARPSGGRCKVRKTTAGTTW